MSCDGSIGGPFGPACSCPVEDAKREADTLTISRQEYTDLLKDRVKLRRLELLMEGLEMFGVDEWEGYDLAMAHAKGHL